MPGLIFGPSASDELSAWVYMADLRGGDPLTYNKICETQVISVTYLRITEPAPQLCAVFGQSSALVAPVAVEPLFGRRKQPAINFAAEPARRPARPIRRQ